jgi:hypothetical protein
MQRTLSSAQTFVMKFILPPLWITGFGLGTLALFMPGDGFHDNTGAPPPPEMKWTLLGAWLLGSAFIYWSCVRLKRVRMDDDALYISNYQKEIRVLLRDVAAISENRWLNIHPVTIELSRPTEFGDRIVFMPKVRWFGFWSSHPVVAELREAARRAARGERG